MAWIYKKNAENDLNTAPRCLKHFARTSVKSFSGIVTYWLSKNTHRNWLDPLEIHSTSSTVSEKCSEISFPRLNWYPLTVADAGWRRRWPVGEKVIFLSAGQTSIFISTCRQTPGVEYIFLDVNAAVCCNLCGRKAESFVEWVTGFDYITDLS